MISREIRICSLHFQVFSMETVSPALVTAVIILSIVFTFIIVCRNTRKCKLLRKIPGPKSHFMFGNILQIIVPETELLSAGMNLIKDFTNIGIAKVWIGYKPYIFLLKAETVQPLLSSRKEINKSDVYDLLSQSGMPQNGIAVSKGEQWHKRRKLLNPAFNFRVLGEFLETFNLKSHRFVQKLKNDAGKCVDFYYLTTLLALDIICTTSMGYDVNAEQDERLTYLTASSVCTRAIFKRIISPWYHPQFIWKNSSIGKEYYKCVNYTANLINKIISSKRQELHQRKMQMENGQVADKLSDKSPTFLDLLIEFTDDEGKALTDVDIREEVDAIIYAGHDSTSLSIFWSLFYVGRHPEVQEKVHREVDRIFGDSDRPVTKDDLAELKYVACIYKEALRLCPSFPVVARKLQEDLQIGEYTVPGGTDVLIPIYAIHRDPDYFPDPEKFDPDRFSSDNLNARHPYAFIPFSAGPRNCIGQKYATMEVKVILAYIFRNFKITTIYNGEVKKMIQLVLRPVPEETLVLLEKRETRYT